MRDSILTGIVLVMCAGLAVGLRSFLVRTIGPTGRKFLRPIGLSLMVAGLVLSAFQFSILSEYQQMQSWPVTDGIVISSGIKGTYAHHPEIEYSYSVQGRTYRAVSDLQAPGFGGKRKRAEAAEVLTSEHSIGDSVRVHFDPSSPSTARIYISPPWHLFGRLGFGLVLWMAGLVLLT
ncbi:MAG: DUF3592 domain-containing protein, partial [Candidatus Zixiibacteriota bacterium]